MDENNEKLGKIAKVFLIILGLGVAAHWIAAMLGQWWFGWGMDIVNDNRISAAILAIVAMFIWTKKKDW